PNRVLGRARLPTPGSAYRRGVPPRAEPRKTQKVEAWPADHARRRAGSRPVPNLADHCRPSRRRPGPGLQSLPGFIAVVWFGTNVGVSVTSGLAWLDSSREEQQRIRDLLNLFSETESR